MRTATRNHPASAGGTVLIGDVAVHRLGFGSMQLAGPGVWGDPPDMQEAVRVLRRAVDLGVDFVDTADSYGPYCTEELIQKALHPYNGVLVATKGGLVRTGPGEWKPLGRPEYLRQEVEMSLRRLGLDHIGLYQLHRIDPQVPVADSLAELVALQEEGKIRHIGLSQVTLAQIEQAQQTATIVSVQNLYNLTSRKADPTLEYCQQAGIAFIPWFPIGGGLLTRSAGAAQDVAMEQAATPAQVALAWLLHRSPAMLPIPGTASVAHLEENVAATAVRLSGEQYQRLLMSA